MTALLPLVQLVLAGATQPLHALPVEPASLVTPLMQPAAAAQPPARRQRTQRAAARARARRAVVQVALAPPELQLTRAARAGEPVVDPLVFEPPPDDAGAATAAPCFADVCEGAVSVPGFEGRGYRPRRSELFLKLLARAPFPRVAAVASYLAESNVQLDYRPGGTGRERGWGRVVVSLRWRLDATGPIREDEAPTAQ